MFSLFSKIKSWLYKDATIMTEEEYDEREASEEYEELTCKMCGKDAKECLLIEDRSGDFYCQSCFDIIYDKDMRYIEGVGFFKSLR